MNTMFNVKNIEISINFIFFGFWKHFFQIHMYLVTCIVSTSRDIICNIFTITSCSIVLNFHLITFFSQPNVTFDHPLPSAPLARQDSILARGLNSECVICLDRQVLSNISCNSDYFQLQCHFLAHIFISMYHDIL